MGMELVFSFQLSLESQWGHSLISLGLLPKLSHSRSKKSLQKPLHFKAPLQSLAPLHVLVYAISGLYIMWQLPYGCQMGSQG